MMTYSWLEDQKMLMKTLMTAEELRISQHALDALHKVLTMMLTGELVWIERQYVATDKTCKNGFNMGFWDVSRNDLLHQCGTVRCIGGWTESVGDFLFRNSFDSCYGEYRYTSSGRKLTKSETEALTPELRNLFFEPVTRLTNITLEQAAAALHNYLTTGHANWQQALGR
jgi:hypothetical protein